jgi:hypothetical protein
MIKSPTQLINQLHQIQPVQCDTVRCDGPPHRPEFEVCLKIKCNSDTLSFTGIGSSKKRAREDASAQALQHLLSIENLLSFKELLEVNSYFSAAGTTAQPPDDHQITIAHTTRSEFEAKLVEIIPSESEFEKGIRKRVIESDDEIDDESDLQFNYIAKQIPHTPSTTPSTTSSTTSSATTSTSFNSQLTKQNMKSHKNKKKNCQKLIKLIIQ